MNAALVYSAIGVLASAAGRREEGLFDQLWFFLMTVVFFALAMWELFS